MRTSSQTRWDELFEKAFLSKFAQTKNFSSPLFLASLSLWWISWLYLKLEDPMTGNSVTSKKGNIFLLKPTAIKYRGSSWRRPRCQHARNGMGSHGRMDYNKTESEESRLADNGEAALFLLDPDKSN